jgi:hypothetical protein
MEEKPTGDPRDVIITRTLLLCERDTPPLALWLLAEYLHSMLQMVSWLEEQRLGDDEAA